MCRKFLLFNYLFLNNIFFVCHWVCKIFLRTEWSLKLTIKYYNLYEKDITKLCIKEWNSLFNFRKIKKETIKRIEMQVMLFWKFSNRGTFCESLIHLNCYSDRTDIGWDWEEPLWWPSLCSGFRRFQERIEKLVLHMYILLLSLSMEGI